ncbi:transposase [Brevundimonas sp.]|uniref:IS91 family transposase n=1 Tax=Brevundimonas sp. TaxID=1871086 RepID=UPI00272F705D|nr:transposase [Brevundimonas sp.]MDP1911697.1 transposase [Brevundimonas sp.]
MIRLASIVGDFEADFLAQFGTRLNGDHLHALAAIRTCRGPASPMMQVQCTGCDHQKLVPHSCGHRLCPHCQHHESQAWLERQMQRLVPADYFLVTFTLPAEFRGLASARADVVLDLVMRCAWDTVRTFSQNDRQLQGTPGAIAVLHTHTRRLDYHPHVHLVVPAAAVDAAKQRWRRKRRTRKGTYLFNEKALAKVFRAKLLAALEAAGVRLPARYPQEWVAHCKAVGAGQKALIYLGRYLYRGVIREQDILACHNGRVSFRYRDAETGRLEKRSLAGADFLWLVLQHVLPRGFRRARNYGFLHANCKRLIVLLHLLLRFDPARFVPPRKLRPLVRCPCCGAVMMVVRTRIRAAPAAAVTDPPVSGVLF